MSESSGIYGMWPPQAPVIIGNKKETKERERIKKEGGKEAGKERIRAHFSMPPG